LPAAKASEYRLFLLDTSNSMNEKLRGVQKMRIAKDGVRRFYMELLPAYYPEWPLKVGITTFRLMGVLGKTKIQEVVSPLVSPTKAELEHFDTLKGAGGSPIYDALRYARESMKTIDSIDRWSNPIKRIKLIGDGGNDGPNPLPFCEKLVESKIILDCVELASKPSAFLAELASKGRGLHYCVRSVDELVMALSLPRFTEKF
jgi:Mg-chelatase subunit ChlD